METVHKDLSYPLPRFSKSFASSLFDLFVTVLLGTALLFASQQIMKSSSSFTKLKEQENAMRVESKLYVQSDYVVSLPEHFEKNDYSRSQKIEAYEENLSYFFNVFLDETPEMKGEERYLEDKAKARYGENPLFDTSGNRVQMHPDYDPHYLSFYENEYSSIALGMLRNLPRYHQNANQIFLQEILYAGGSFSIAHLVIYLIVPLCFPRGKKTLGMFFTHLSSVGNNGLSIPWWKQILYWLFRFVFLFWGSLLTFLLPLAISFTMKMTRNDHQNLSDYVCVVHQIDDLNRRVFRDVLEVAAEENKNR